MSADFQVVVYGASGYTGKLIAWKLAERGIPFIAAGRNQQRLEEQMAAVPELKGAEYRCQAVEHDEAALTELFRGKKVVYNVVGPFLWLGDPVVKACLNAGCHYLDTTGEQDWMLHAKRTYHEAFAQRNLLLAPACSFMWTAGALAAELVLETEGVDSLDICYVTSGLPSVASAQSFMRMNCQPQHYLQDNELVAWPAATGFQVSVPGNHRVGLALPWGGAGEPAWYEGDARVRNCRTLLVSPHDDSVFTAILGLMKEFEEKGRSLPPEQQRELTNGWTTMIVQQEPARDEPLRDRNFISCHGRGSAVSRHITLATTCGYTQTAIMAASAVSRVLKNEAAGKGFVNPARALGTRYLIDEMAKEGFHCTVE